MDRFIRKANAFEIINHWVMALSCLILAVQGYGFLFHIQWIGSVFGGFNTVRTLHNYLGIAFSVALFFSLFLYLRESLTFDADDVRWLTVFGGYLSRSVEVPPMGKINTGQKLYYLTVLVFGVGIAASGFGMWLVSGDRQLMKYFHLIHNVSFVILIAAIASHIYLATFANPGTFRIMVYGTVPYDWAKRRHPKWVAEVERRGHKA
jgi:formate dehydrogenase subunit gamma